jgi:hypothetical protein
MTDTKPRRFILQAIHPDYGCPAFETMFAVEQLDELRSLLGEAAKSDPDLEYHYTLEPAEVRAINRQFDVHFDSGGRVACLCRWTWLRGVPYLVHTGYELPLMLEGRKQFARMCEEYPPERHYGEDQFDHYVAQGLLHKKVETEKFAKPTRLKNGHVFDGLRTVYYTRQGEEWRIEAWNLIEEASRKSGWNETLERLEGMLFGYEDWQNDWWIESLRKRGQQFGTILLYLAVTASELSGIEHTGFRALPPMNRMLTVGSALGDEPSGDELQRLGCTDDWLSLVRFRVKARAFLELIGMKQERFHRLPPNRIKDLNRLIVESVEIVTNRDRLCN